MDKEIIATPRGRGSVLLAALQRKRQEMNENIGIKLPSSEEVGNKGSVPRGRGALILAALKERKSKTQENVGSQIIGSFEEQCPKPRGRAALLEKYFRGKEVGALLNEAKIDTSRTRPDETLVQEITKINIKDEPAVFKGESGKMIDLCTNYIKLDITEGKGVFEYEVKFNPTIDAKNHKIELVNKIMGDLKLAKVFDGGHCLYLPQKIITSQRSYKLILSHNNEEVTITLIFKKQKRLGDKDCIHLYNVIFKRIMHLLLYTRLGKNYYDMTHRYLIPQHKLEVYPGFVVSIDEHENGLMLGLDIQHKMIQNQTAYDLLVEKKITSDSRNFKENVYKMFLGMCVLTRYNYKTYIIHDILWDMTPKDTFQTSDGRSLSFIDYYKNQYKLEIKDHDQPLFLNRKSVKVPGSLQKEDRMVCLIPELCYLTALSDSMRSDFSLMKEVAQCTKVSPQQRLLALKNYIDNVKNCAKAQEILEQWGLSLASDNIQLVGRELDAEMIVLGKGKTISAGFNADWNRELSNNSALMPVDILEWIVFYTAQDAVNANEFVRNMERLSKTIGCRINAPRMEKLPNDQTHTYVNYVKNKITNSTQVAVFICPTMRLDRYCVIKKLCCTELPVASQVINSRTLSRSDKLNSITLKIALQINCKLGGSLWTVRFPFRGWMVCGIDVYHGTQNQSVCGFVCNVNEHFTRWFSSAIFQSKELGDFYQIAFTRALEEYKSHCAAYPSKIIIIRDGVGDGQLDYCKQYELRQFENVLKSFDIEATICFIVVQKRINTRLFAENAKNPPPGTIVDHTITRKYLYDFFMVAQNVRHATVNPTHYIVLHNSSQLKPDHIQKLCYKLCHMYYNWPGTIKVPAPCQYAHKCAAMVGQFVKTQPSSELANKLWYL
ncbi:hypothetical protein GWI33_001668 [Rhynchophorus ferrugineus]|uniref:Uncharacterized protein n=1 Tax=Rhynchophorus ferrugineus TaxID=354439 RepID=A0A834IZU4_RHYFE|nr:hypothetical protein GWI33_001668 [Rhynchophorus ferrugineus]